MTKDLLTQLVTALRDDAYLGHEGWQYLQQRTQRATERYNLWGVLYHLAKESPDFDSTGIEESYTMQQVGTTLQVLVLTYEGEEYLSILPPPVRAWAGLDKLPEPLLRELTELNAQQVPFAELASRLETDLTPYAS